MNTPLPIRAKLMTAAVSLVLPGGFSILHTLGIRSTGEVVFRVCCVVIATLLAFGGVFGNPQLQVLWGGGLAIAAPALAVLCIFEFRGPALTLGLIGTVIAANGGYLLLMDSSVKNHRESLRKKHVT